MTPAEVMALARTLTHTNTTNVPDATDWLTFLNLVYHDVVNTVISNIGEQYFREDYLADFTADTTEFSFDTITWGTGDVAKLLNVYIKYWTSDDYTKCIYYNENDLAYDVSWYEDNQWQSSPFFLLREKTISILPQTDTTITNWIKITTIQTSNDLEAAWAETTILIPREHHEILAIGMKQYIYSKQWKTDDKKDAEREYKDAKFDFITYMSNKMGRPIVWDLLDWSEFH